MKVQNTGSLFWTVSDTLKKLNALSGETCAELTATTKRRKLTGRDHSIMARLARAKGQAKQPTVAGEKSTEPRLREGVL